MSIIWSNPVNRAHPLNKGLTAWWLNTPTNHGGSTFRDIAGQNHATLTGMVASDWQRDTRKNRWGSVAFDGTVAKYINCGNDDSLKPGTHDWSFAFWGKTPAGGGFYSPLGDWVNNGTLVRNEQTSGAILVKMYATSGADRTWRTNTTNFKDNAWHQCVFTFVNATATGLLYIDTNEETDVIGTTGTPAGGNFTFTHNFFLGRDTAGNWPWDGNLDDIRIWNRKLSATEVIELYQLSMTGYGGLINRRRRVVNAPAAAPAGNAMPMAMHHYRQRRAG